KEVAVRETEYAVAHGVDVSFVTEDTFRADLDFVVDLYNACTNAGAHRAVVCDTVGVMTPPGIRWFFGQLKERLVPTELSFHGHNDFGLAVANSLAAVEEGVQVPHTCVNGLGERSGNASFEELVLALEALYEYDTGIEVARLYELSRLVSLIKDFSEARSKKDQQDFIRSFRERVARQRGVTDDEFRSLAEKAGIAVREPPESRGSD